MAEIVASMVTNAKRKTVKPEAIAKVLKGYAFARRNMVVARTISNRARGMMFRALHDRDERWKQFYFSISAVAPFAEDGDFVPADSRAAALLESAMSKGVKLNALVTEFDEFSQQLLPQQAPQGEALKRAHRAVEAPPDGGLPVVEKKAKVGDGTNPPLTPLLHPNPNPTLTSTLATSLAHTYTSP